MKPLPQLRKKYRRLLLVISSLVVLLTLFAGLSPRGSYSDNWVSAANQSLGLNLGIHGFLHGVLPRNPEITTHDYFLNLSMNVVMREQSDTTFRFLLFWGDGCSDNPLIIGQWRNRLIAMQGCDFPNKSKRVRLNSKIDAALDKLTTISLKISNNKSELFLNEVQVSEKNTPIYTPTTTRNSIIIIGNSPNGNHGWSGTINSINIVEETKDISSTRSTISQHSFVFNRPTEHSEFKNQSDSSNAVVKIAKMGWFPHPDVLTRYSIASLIEHNKFDIAVNLLGFLPLGICTAAILFTYFKLHGLTLITTTFVLGTFLSFFIELMQTFIAGRRSNLHDVLLNSLGTLVGLIVFLVVAMLFIHGKFITEPFESENNLEK